MFDRKLFLGFPVDSRFENALITANTQLLSKFVHPNSQYLQEVNFQNQRYFGSFVPSPSEISELELKKSHIYSVLKRIVPQYPYDQSQLILFPVIELVKSEI